MTLRFRLGVTILTVSYGITTKARRGTFGTLAGSRTGQEACRSEARGHVLERAVRLRNSTHILKQRVAHASMVRTTSGWASRLIRCSRDILPVSMQCQKSRSGVRDHKGTVPVVHIEGLHILRSASEDSVALRREQHACDISEVVVSLQWDRQGRQFDRVHRRKLCSVLQAMQSREDRHDHHGILGVGGARACPHIRERPWLTVAGFPKHPLARGKHRILGDLMPQEWSAK